MRSIAACRLIFRSRSHFTLNRIALSHQRSRHHGQVYAGRLLWKENTIRNGKRHHGWLQDGRASARNCVKNSRSNGTMPQNKWDGIYLILVGGACLSTHPWTCLRASATAKWRWHSCKFREGDAVSSDAERNCHPGAAPPIRTVRDEPPKWWLTCRAILWSNERLCDADSKRNTEWQHFADVLDNHALYAPSLMTNVSSLQRGLFESPQKRQKPRRLEEALTRRGWKQITVDLLAHRRSWWGPITAISNCQCNLEAPRRKGKTGLMAFFEFWTLRRLEETITSDIYLFICLSIYPQRRANTVIAEQHEHEETKKIRQKSQAPIWTWRGRHSWRRRPNQDSRIWSSPGLPGRLCLLDRLIGTSLVCEVRILSCPSAGHRKTLVV